MIYTDGACSGNPGPGGWAAILRYNQHEKVLQGAEAHTTNNRMELTAVIKALQALKEPCRVDVYTDSNYIVRAFRKDGWNAGNATAGAPPARNPSKTRTCGGRCWNSPADTTCVFLKVKGHADDALNNRVDRLAVEAMRRGQTETPDSSVSAVND
nr:RNase H family protein [Rhodothermus marinus]